MVEGRQTCIFTVCRVLGSVASGAGEQRTERFDSIVGSGLGPKIVHTHVDGSRLFSGPNLNSSVQAFQDTQPVVEIATSC